MNRISLVIAAALVAAVARAPVSAIVHQVNVANFVFAPRNLTVVKGDVVQWNWVSGTHTVTSGDTLTCTPDGLFDTPVNQTHPTFQFTFGQMGTFPYYCTFHCAMGMRGLITVLPDPLAVPDGPDSSPVQARTLSAFPNPFFSQTTVHLQLAQEEGVRVQVYDVAGRPIAILADQAFAPGAYSLVWDGRNEAGQPAPSGVYYAKAETAGASNTARLLLMR